MRNVDMVPDYLVEGLQDKENREAKEGGDHPLWERLDVAGIPMIFRTAILRSSRGDRSDRRKSGR